MKGQIAAQRQAEAAFKLQKQQLAMQEQQLADLDEQQKNKKYNEQRLLEGKLKSRMGRSATILTNNDTFGNNDISNKSLYA
jgi:hypothetical protein